MLQFVHVDGANGGKDLQTRRKVRSQAMRDFRRRQRAEKEAGKHCVKGSHRSLSLPNEGSSPAPAARDRAASTDSGLSDLSTRRSRRSSQKRTSTRPAQKDGESTFKIRSPNLASQVAHDLATEDLVDEWQNAIDGTSAQSLDPTYWTSSFANEFPSSGLLEPITTTEGGIEQDLDSFTQMSQLLELCHHCGHSATGSWCRDGICDHCAWSKLEAGPMPGMPGHIPPNFDWLP